MIRIMMMTIINIIYYNENGENIENSLGFDIEIIGDADIFPILEVVQIPESMVLLIPAISFS